MISIIIPIYNQAGKLSSCLDSILKQAYKNYEVIIVNDGSTDNIEEVFKKNKFRFKSRYLLINQKNRGAPAARNRGFKESKGEYLFFCDADAVLMPECLEVMLKELETHLEASYVYSSFYWGRKLFKLEKFSKKKLRQMPYIHTMSLIRREHFPEFGWDESIKKLQDWDLWLTMLKDGHTGYWVNKILFKIKTGGTMSDWLPSFAYKIFPFLPNVKKYKKAVDKIKKKHLLKY